MIKKISILIPVFNEIDRIEKCINDVLSVDIEHFDKEIIISDNNSNDGTKEYLKNIRDKKIKVLFQKINNGKGSNLRNALKYATGDIVIFQDADMEYDPNDYKNILKPVKNFNADLVIGSRLSGPPMTRVSYFWNKQGNRLITFLFNLFYNTTFTDIYSCYVVIKKNLLNINKIKTNGWEQQAEILSQVVLKSKVIFEVPINYFGRSYEEGKKIRPYHIFKII